MAKKKIVQEKQGAKLIAYADFSLDGVDYSAGDEFTVPAGYKRDIEFETLRNLDRPKGTPNGLVFAKDFPAPVKGEMDTKRQVLPLEEV